VEGIHVVGGFTPTKRQVSFMCLIMYVMHICATSKCIMCSIACGFTVNLV
jgi:hypothetical protein